MTFNVVGHILAYPSQSLESQIASIAFGAQLDDDLSGLAEDTTHPADFCASLWDVFLIYGDSIDPDNSMRIRPPKMLKCGKKILSNV
jgi:uncharacterized protein (DUF2342 family)